jgi:NAD(P)H-flavin reductase
VSDSSTNMAPSVLPPNPWVAETVEIRKITPEIENVVTYQLAFTDPVVASGYRFSPGQFNMLYLPGAGESAISMSGDPESREVFDHTIRVAGNVTRGLTELRPGDTIGLRGPFGSSWPMEQCVGRDVVLVTGGIGLPPLRPVIYQLLREREKYGQINLLYGARSPDTLLYSHEYDDWQQQDMVVHLTVDRSAPGWSANVGVVTVLLERLPAFDPSNTVLMCCGPEVMMRFVARTAFERGMSPTQIWVSTERNMNCAIGLCGHCQLGPAFICKDGPVFRYDKISPYLKVDGL